MDKDFSDADGLLSQVYTAVEGGKVVVDDSAKKWMVIWDAAPAAQRKYGYNDYGVRCRDIAERVGKVEEVEGLLKKFGGKEELVWRKLVDRYGEE